jgi:hypothetical protein
MEYTIPIMAVFMKKKWLYALSLLWAQNKFTFGLTRTCSRETSGFSLSQTTDMKHALITGNYGVQKSFIVLYLMKHLRTEFLTNHLICICKALNDG